MLSLRSAMLTVAALALLVGPTVYLSRGSAPHRGDGALPAARAYLRAVYARDFQKAYRHISTPDRRVRDEASYLKSQASYSGFAAQVARTLAEYGDIRILKQTIESEHPRIEIAYRFPAPEDLAPLVLNWDEEKLDALLPVERLRLLAVLHQRHRDGKLVMVQGQETFDLVNEGHGWRIFFDWASGLKVSLNAAPPDATIAIRFAQDAIIVTSDDPFQVNLVIRNSGKHARTFALTHIVEPREIADQLEMIECGLSRPVTLEPNSEREFAMAYLLSNQARHNRKEIKLTYLLRLTRGAS